MRSTCSLLACLVLATIASCGGKNGNGDDFPAKACADGIDNDGDGTIDFPEDLGCISEDDDTEDSLTMPQCSDGRDNDGDGKKDYPADPGCYAPQQDDELDDCPTGPHCPQCADGRDNDGNGATDYPDDPGCTSASDDDEFLHNPVACGAGMMIQQLNTTGVAMGMLDTTSKSMVASPCGGGGDLPSIAYELHLSKPQVVVVSTDDPLTTADTVLDIRSDECSTEGAEIACNDDLTSTNSNSTITTSLAAGNYYIVVTAKDAGSIGNFNLTVKRFAGEGTACTAMGDCGPGLVCRVPMGETAMVCSKPMCSDGVDDDADGKNDYPTDPGCTSPDDNDETDTCPNGASCPECGDGRDNDMDGATDYPADTTCLAAGDPSESCTTTDGVALVTMPATPGDTSLATAHNDTHPSCGTTGTHTANDLTYRLDLPATTTLSLSLTGSTFFAANSLFNASCGGTPLNCTTSNTTTMSNLAAGTYYFVVDGYSTGQGPFTLNVSGKIGPNQSCQGALAAAGALTCSTGYACKGPATAKTCQPALCNDGIDNDADGKIDYPFDPGCSSPADDTEANPTPLPVCADGMDNDTDSTTDWPADYGCSSASGTSEAFCPVEVDATSLITTPTVTGTTAGKASNFTGATCQTNGSGPDVAFAISLPVAVQTLVVDASNSAFDTILSLRDTQCTTELGCDDDNGDPGLQSKMTLSNLNAGNYAIVLDGYGGASGAYTLNVKGTLAAQTACTSPLFTAGVLVCATGTTCTAGKCQ